MEPPCGFYGSSEPEVVWAVLVEGPGVMLSDLQRCYPCGRILEGFPKNGSYIAFI